MHSMGGEEEKSAERCDPQGHPVAPRVQKSAYVYKYKRFQQNIGVRLDSREANCMKGNALSE